MLIDFHMHVFPDNLAEKAVKKLSKTAGMPYNTDGTVLDTRNKLDQWGIDCGVVMQIATKPGQQKSINDWASSIQWGKVLCFGSIHPDAGDALEELHRIKELGLKGVKLHPDYQNFMIDEERMFPIYETITRLRLPVMFHTGFDAVSPDLIHAPSKSVARVASLFPSMKVIAAHMGGLDRYDEAEEYLISSNIYFDTSMSSIFCRPEQFERMIKKHGADRILFATDCPWSNPLDELELINRIDITEDDKQKIFYKNAVKLLGIHKPI